MLKSINTPNDKKRIQGIAARLEREAREIASIATEEVMFGNDGAEVIELNAKASKLLIFANQLRAKLEPPVQKDQFMVVTVAGMK